jgi:heme-degrading monooxygenase HmoA
MSREQLDKSTIMKQYLYSALILGLIVLPQTISLPVFAQATSSPAPSKSNSSRSQDQKVIARIWHGRTSATKADEYYEYLKEAGINKIEAIPGNLGVQIFRGTDGKVTDFTVISYWESLEAIRKFAGNDIEKTHSLPKDRQYLLEIEPKVRHYEVLLDNRKRAILLPSNPQY